MNIQYEFESIGPQGVIKKIVEYKTRRFDQEELLNLAVGDWNEFLQRAIHDKKSNNRDTNMVLATIASVCIEMMSLNPTFRVLAEGATPARNRLYRIGIAKHWNEIDAMFDVDGFRSGRWEPFQPGINFNAFRIKWKKPNKSFPTEIYARCSILSKTTLKNDSRKIATATAPF